jgi:hypothetical protein
MPIGLSRLQTLQNRNSFPQAAERQGQNSKPPSGRKHNKFLRLQIGIRDLINLDRDLETRPISVFCRFYWKKKISVHILDTTP